MAVSMALVVSSCARISFEDGMDLPEPLHPAAAKSEAKAEKKEAPAASTNAAASQRYTLKGTGEFVNTRASLAQAYREPSGDITLNFVNAEIGEVSRAVLGGILGINFAVDPAVKGTVTVQTSRPIPRSSVLRALESAFAVVGVAVVRSPGITRVVPLAKAPKQAAPLTISGTSPVGSGGFAIRIVPLKFVSADEMKKILTPLASQESVVTADAARNLIMLAAPSPELRVLEDTIATFDVDWLKGLSISMIPLEFVDPETLVKEIDDILGKDKSPLSGVLRFVPLKRMNSVLVMSTQPDYLERAQALVERLDHGASGAERQLFVYYAQNTNANDMAESLGKLFGAQGGGRTVQEALAPQLTPSRVPVRTGGATTTGTGGTATATTYGTTSPTQAGATATTATTGGGRSTLMGSGGGGRTVSTSRERGPGSSAAITIAGSDEIRVVADRTNNALLVWSTPADYRMVRDVLKKLDVMPMQVLIEATIAEVTLNKTLRYGLQWFFRSGDSSFTLSSGNTGAIAPSFPGFSYFLNGTDVKAILDALETITDLKIISSPQLMVLDNQTALLQVGDQVPILTQQSQSTIDSTAPIVNSIQYRDTGIILRVTPRVNSGGLVSLDIEQEASLVADTTTTEGIDSPTFRQRLISSTVAVQSGETVALGGLIQDTKDNSASGIPFLRRLPVLGALFGEESKTDKRTELLVLITPRAVRSQQEIRAVTEEMRQRLRTIRPLGARIQ